MGAVEILIIIIIIPCWTKTTALAIPGHCVTFSEVLQTLHYYDPIRTLHP